MEPPVFILSAACFVVLSSIAMAAVATETDFIVSGIDQAALGPVERPALVSWVKDERVTAAPWTFAARNGSRQKAPDLPGLQITRGASKQILSSSQLAVPMASIRPDPLQSFIGGKALSAGWFSACFPSRFQPEGFAV